MSYVSIIKATTKNIITLVEIDLGKIQDLFVNYTAGVWMYKWEQTGYTFAIGDGAIGENPIGYGDKRSFMRLSSVFVDGTEYTEKASISDVISNKKSWYFGDNALYIHFDNDNEAQLFSVTIGLTVGYSNKAVWFNDLYYEPRIIGVPTIEKSKDPLFFGLLAFDGGSISLINTDGALDNLIDNYVFGQPVRIYFGGEGLDYDDYMRVYTGYIESISMNFENVNIELADERKRLSVVLPVNQFNKTDYPDLDDDDIGKGIPIAYGEVYHAEPVCINKTQSGTSDWEFKVCDVADHSNGIQSIDKVYVDGAEVSTTAINLTNGTFKIAYSSWDGNKKVMVDFKGVKDSSGNYITNPLDIIIDILETYAEINYNDDNFVTDEWVDARNHNLANNIGLYINNEVEIKDIIEDICKSVMGIFIVRDDGKYTFKIYEVTDPLETIEIKEVLDNNINIEWDGTEFLSSCGIKYKKNWSESRYRVYVNDNEEDSIFEKYKKHSYRAFETLLVNETDAQELSEAFMEYYKDVKPIYHIKTFTKGFLFDVGDTIGLEINRENKVIQGYVRAEVLSVSKNILDGITEITARYIDSNVVWLNQSPYAINIDEYAINIDNYALSYGRRSV